MPRQVTTIASEREGCRWLHNPPSGVEFAEWFEKNVPIHDGLNAADYVNGVTLIPNKERINVTREDQSGKPTIVETERLVFSPHPQVETRIRYFWDWCRHNGYLGTIDILSVRDQDAHLPAGIFAMNAKGKNGDAHTFLGAKCRVRACMPELRAGGSKGRLVIEPPDATKMVPLHTRYGPDVNAAMKAETGAIGRALGFAGMLVIPGAGISTAEDMREFLAAEPSLPGAAPEATLPATETTVGRPAETLLRTVGELATELKAFPEAWAQTEAWAKERGTDLENPPPAALRPLERQLRRKLDQAKKAAESGS